MPKIDPAKITVRTMKKEDIDAIVEIDARVLGEKRADYYERKCTLALDSTIQLVTSLVAEYDGRVVGFIMGNIFMGEFGIPEASASLDTIGVDPDFQGKGIAVELIKQFIRNARKAHVEYLYTLVDWNDWDMLRFFEKSGFVPAKAIKLELKLS